MPCTPLKPFVASVTLLGSIVWEAQSLKEAARSNVAMATEEYIFDDGYRMMRFVR